MFIKLKMTQEKALKLYASDKVSGYTGRIGCVYTPNQDEEESYFIDSNLGECDCIMTIEGAHCHFYAETI